jgi:hypothetical protein
MFYLNLGYIVPHFNTNRHKANPTINSNMGVLISFISILVQNPILTDYFPSLVVVVM